MNCSASNPTCIIAGDSILQGNQSTPVGNISVTMQGDGNLVLRDAASNPIWWAFDAPGLFQQGFSASSPHLCDGNNCYADFQSDGNLVLYNSAGVAYWATETSGHNNSRLTISQNYPLISISDQNSLPVWVSSVAPNMANMKKGACNADGFLNPNATDGDAADTLSMLARSSCYYLPRSVELWAAVPNFSQIQGNLLQLKNQAPTGKTFVYSVFFPEAIPSTSQTLNDLSGNSHTFDFSTFCAAGSVGHWGSGTCIPDLTNQGYQNYLQFLVDQFTSLGIDVFQFGQVEIMDPTLAAGALYANLKSFAATKGIPILVGAQSNKITNSGYLSHFDFIVGGSYINRFGLVATNGNLSGLGAQAQTSALLWVAPYNSNPNAFIEFDWWNTDDDIHRFATLSASDRQRVAQSLYDYFANLGVGFIFPYRTLLNGGPGISSTCHESGNVFVYSASQSACGDETTFNQLMNNGPTASASQQQALGNIILNAGNVIQNFIGPGASVELKMQGDGNLVLYPATIVNGVVQDGTALWSTNTARGSCPNCTAALQANGNIVLYDQNGQWYWQSSTTGSNGSELAVSSTEPYLSVMDSNQDILWTSTNNYSSMYIPENSFVQVGTLKLFMQNNGELVLYNASGGAVWYDGVTTAGCGVNGCAGAFQGDGNFVAYNGSTALWNTGTATAGSQMRLSQAPPYLQIVSPQNSVLWQSN